jgi:hypothetical protein
MEGGFGVNPDKGAIQGPVASVLIFSAFIKLRRRPTVSVTSFSLGEHFTSFVEAQVNDGRYSNA